MTAAKRPHSYAGLFLMLYLLSAGAASRVAAEAQSPGEKFVAYIVPLTFLSLGVFTAFKSGGRVAKTSASLLVGVNLAAFSVGLFRGYQEHYVPSEVRNEMRDLQAGIGLDLSSDATGAELVRRRTERTNEAARRLQASDDPKAAEAGRAIDLLTRLASEPDERFIAAVDALDMERLLDVSDMVEGRQFEWRREVLAEYAAAARNALYHFEAFPERVQAMIAREGISNKFAEGMLAGVRDTQPYLLECWRKHESVAGAYLEIVELVARNCDGMQLHQDGRFEFSDSTTYEAFERTTERAIAAEESLEAAISRLAVIQQG
ncbi:MAG TPA: hypothetical protein VMT18_15515 [Planctomycetota bacterium]|nr:hypothetical protein [Planctomycetota bacterium]